MVPEGIPPRKRTRDLPKFSECHNCGYRLKTNNPKDKLQPLNSHWRVLLLCKPCLRGVDSSKLCSYCFNNVFSNEDEAVPFFKCTICSHSVHNDCIVRYKNSAPWCYMTYPGRNRNNVGGGNGNANGSFRVCVDCWMPKEIVKSSPALRGSTEKKLSGIKTRSVITAGDENTDNDDDDDDGDTTTATTTNNNEIIKKSFEDARKKPACKSATKKNLTNLANDVKKRDNMKNETKVENKEANEKKALIGNAVEDKDVDDAELAFRLHRAMNSSRRMTKGLSSGNLRNSANSRSVLGVNNSFYGKSYVRKKRARYVRGVDESLTRTSDFKDDIVNLSVKDEEGSYSIDSMVTESESFSRRKHDGQMHELQSNSCSYLNGSNVCKESVMYLFKYNRKKSGLKPLKNHNDKLLCDPCCLESRDPASTLLNSSGESKTVSEASFQSYIVPVQTSTDASGSSH